MHFLEMLHNPHSGKTATMYKIGKARRLVAEHYVGYLAAREKVARMKINQNSAHNFLDFLVTTGKVTV